MKGACELLGPSGVSLRFAKCCNVCNMGMSQTRQSSKSKFEKDM